MRLAPAIFVVIFVAALGSLSFPASAQTLLGITLGEPIPEGLPTAAATQTQPPFSQTVWDSIEGTSLSAIADAETGEVLFVEMRYAGPEAAQIHGLTLGQTTRTEIHARFGSEGLVFADVGRTGVFGDIAAHFTNYEIADTDTVVSFVTIQPLAEASAETAGQSVLDSVVVAQSVYLNQVWGFNRGRLAGYAPITDPFTQE